MRLPFVIAAGIFIPAYLAEAQENKGPYGITIPFKDLRKYLPEDGKIFTHTIRANVWKDQQIPFERDESIEVALGTRLRAQQKHRNKEHDELKRIGEGITAAKGFLNVTAGWRAKVKQRFNDHYDGTVTGKVKLEMKEGKIFATVYDVDVNWDRGLGDQIINLVGGIQGRLAEKATEEANKHLSQLTKELDQRIDGFFREQPALAPLRNDIKIDIVEGAIVLTLQKAPLSPGNVPAPLKNNPEPRERPLRK